MFEAVAPGQHTRGNWTNRAEVSPLKARLINGNPGVELDVKAVKDGAELTLTITNRSKHDWPTLASIVACFNPGPAKTRNRQFANTKTWFNSANGLTRLAGKAPREIHFNSALAKLITKEADADGRYAWSQKWPRSEIDAVDGLIIRESTDGRWVTGIAWDRFLAAQGHNPWECMHLSVRVGPLKRGEKRSVKGRIYLLEGTKEELLERYRKEFGHKQIGGQTPQQLLALFGAKGRKGANDRQLATYRRIFGFIDANGDGKHSRREFVEDGRYLTPEARAGIFRASDSNNDGIVSLDEYIENRIITDEAKAIFEDMDKNGDGQLTHKEFVGSKKLKDPKLANAVFSALDSDGNREIVVPEYLRVWGRWARSRHESPPAENVK
jgi:Ca2+-binding EF-hand superfamily protein